MGIEAVFVRILWTSLAAGAAILCILLLRLILKKAKRVYSYVLWIVVLARLIIPFSFELELSPLPYSLTATANHTVERTLTAEYSPADNTLDTNAENSITDEFVAATADKESSQSASLTDVNTYRSISTIAAWVWLIGCLILAVYTTAGYVRLRLKLTTASPLRDNIYLADGITSPFVLGLIRPRIYLPSDTDTRSLPYILAHEETHIRRFDHVIKALAYAAICIHWFNPLVWLAFRLACADMEISCDESAVERLGESSRRDYTESLLTLATDKTNILSLPPSFGGDVGERIDSLTHKKRKSALILAIVIIVIAILAVCLFTIPKAHRTELMGANYTIERVVYNVNDDPLPLQYSLTADYQLYVKYDESEGWEHLGKLEKYPLTTDELLMYVNPDKLDYTPADITDAYILRVEEQDFYLVMQTANGDTLLGYGWEDVTERTYDESDDTLFYRLCLLESSFYPGYVNVNFFERSLTSPVGANVYVFANWENDNLPDFHVVGYKYGDGIKHAEYTGMGFAVFETTGDGYRLLYHYDYDDAVLAENGVFFCPDPVVASLTGEGTRDNSFDVILVCNENVGKIERIYEYEDKDPITQSNYNVNTHSMFLFSWKYDEGMTRVWQYVYDKDGNLMSEDIVSEAETAP